MNHHAAFNSPGVLELVVSSWLALDATIYLNSALEVSDLFRAEPRVRLLPATGSSISDHRITVDVDGAFLLDDAHLFLRALRETKDGLYLEFTSPSSTSSTLAIRSHRSRILRSRPRALDGSDSALAEAGLSRVDGPVRLERHFAGW